MQGVMDVFNMVFGQWTEIHTVVVTLLGTVGAGYIAPNRLITILGQVEDYAQNVSDTAEKAQDVLDKDGSDGEGT